MLTINEVADALPGNFKSAVTQAYVDQINNFVNDPEIADCIRNNFISYTHVLRDGKYKSDDYLNAVAFVSYKHMGYSNLDAYIKVFPHRYSALVAAGKNRTDISPYVSAYANNKLVNAIKEQSLIPMWLINQDVYQKAINTQADIMTTSTNDMARTAAANSILTHLAKPKDSAVNINMNMAENSGMLDLKNTLRQLAVQQRELIEHGVGTRMIAESRIIDVEVD